MSYLTIGIESYQRYSAIFQRLLVNHGEILPAYVRKYDPSRMSHGDCAKVSGLQVVAAQQILGMN